MRLHACMAAVVVFVVACKGGGAGDDFPIIPQGDDTPINPAPDGAMPDASIDGAGGTIAGRVCVVSDLRNLTSGCAETGAADILVQLNSSMTMTGDDGTFEIVPPPGSNLRWTVSGQDYVTSMMPLGATHLIPVVPTALYEDLLLTNGVILQPLQGSIVGRVTMQAAPLAGATVTSTPVAQYAPYYDGTSAAMWDQDATSTAGVFWIVGAPAGSSVVRVRSPTNVTSDLTLPVNEGGITFGAVEFP